MNKEFVPYEQALALKELGFDETCFTYYKNDQLSDILESAAILYLVKNSEMENVNNEVNDYISAPTFSQSLKFFREKYQLPNWVYTSNNKEFWYSILKDGRMIVRDYTPFNSYEEAELACLNKLIELIKNK